MRSGQAASPPGPGGSVGPAASTSSRFAALDWLRGLVMVLMTIDHASAAFNGGRLFADGLSAWQPGLALPADQFLLRWVTHLCAPSFVFLAGASVAFSARRRVATPLGARAFDRYLLVRGAIILGLDPLWMSLAFTPGRILFQVMFAIGGSLLCLALLRRFSTRALFAVGLGIVVGGEALMAALHAVDLAGTAPVAMLLTGGRHGSVIFGYPLLPWLGLLVLGHAFGRVLPSWQRPARRLLFIGLAMLALFLLIRGIDGYGNLKMTRDDASLVQWLHVSKYPPSLAFALLELGVGALLLSAFFALSRGGRAAARLLSPLAVLGQTALFFYILHAHLLVGAAHLFGVHRAYGIGGTLVAALLCVAALWPLCFWYRGYKARYPDGWTRYL